MKPIRAAGWTLIVASSMLLGVGCRRPSGPVVPVVARSASPADSPLRFRAQELPFTYERGETGAAWPGARLTARIGSTTLVRTVDGGGSYISANDPRVHFGLGDAARVDRLEIRWPSGRTETRSDIPADHVFEWSEGGTTE